MSRKKRREVTEVAENKKATTSPKSLLNPLVAKTAGQEIFMDAIQQNEIVICDGPAGSGKTFLAFGSALDAYFKGTVKRIIIVRPTLPAGDDDSLGYLPGDLYEKMGPFIAPLMKDSAPQLLKPETFRKNMTFNDRGVSDPLMSLMAKIDIEVVPLAFIRGRTFHQCFCILDEAQNCTLTDLKLFLTRIGRYSKVVIEGDSTQSDRDDSGLIELMRRLEGMDKVSVVKLCEMDIIRNPLIAEIIKRLGTTR